MPNLLKSKVINAFIEKTEVKKRTPQADKDLANQDGSPDKSPAS